MRSTARDEQGIEAMGGDLRASLLFVPPRRGPVAARTVREPVLAIVGARPWRADTGPVHPDAVIAAYLAADATIRAATG